MPTHDDFRSFIQKMREEISENVCTWRKRISFKGEMGKGKEEEVTHLVQTTNSKDGPQGSSSGLTDDVHCASKLFQPCEVLLTMSWWRPRSLGVLNANVYLCRPLPFHSCADPSSIQTGCGNRGIAVHDPVVPSCLFKASFAMRSDRVEREPR